LNILFKILEEEKPDYLAVAFDVHAPTFRHELFSEYKGTRRPMPDELREQVPLIREVLSAMGIALIMKEGFEGDDLLGTMAVRAEKDGLDVTIVSGDRDLLQLASEKIKILIPKTKGGKTIEEQYHAEDVKAEYGLTPLQIIELKALMGDQSDNIPGLPGVGPKTATKILQMYGTIEEAYEHLDEITPKKAQTAMREHWDKAVLSRKLAAICTEVPFEADLKTMRPENFYTPEAVQLFKRLGLRRLLSQADLPSDTEKKRTIRQITDLSEAEAFFEKLAGCSEVGAAVLAEKQDTGLSKLTGLSLALSADEIVWFSCSGFLTRGYLEQKLTFLSGKGVCLCTWRLKEILQAFSLPDVSGWFDTHLAAYLLDPLGNGYAYDAIASGYGTVPVSSPEEIFGTGKLPPFFEREEEQLVRYAGEIALSAVTTRAGLEKALFDAGMERLYRELEMPLVRVIFEMEKAGIRILPDELQEYGQCLQEGIETMENRIFEAAGERFNIQSPKQLGVILFEKMKLPGGKKTKTGYSTAADVLEKLAPEVPLVKDILEYRQLTRLKSAYADGLPAYIAEDGRIHSTFHQTITATGRLSSADPNLQNIPVRMELGRKIRKVFVPEEGFIF
ncbi:MAG: DNA polymerase I, partial [Eubacterium sp.]|nr:DNA polymerase I [Eubacterium sp.]